MSKVTVIITTYPHLMRDQELIRCLNSVYSQTFIDFEILILENHEDLSFIRQVVLPKDNLRIICDRTKKLSYLFNVCWTNTQSKYLVYLADDVEITQDWLQTIVDELDADSTVGVVTGPIVSTTQPSGEMHRLYLLAQKNLLTKVAFWPYLHFALENNPLAVGKLFDSGAYSFGAGLPESALLARQEIDLATTSSMGIRRLVLEQLQGFDERFSFNHADGDLFIRAKRAGYKVVFNPKVSAKHYMHQGPSRNAYYIGKDTAMFYKKNIKPKSISGMIGLVLNILVLNLYWIYSAFRFKKISQLRGTVGFFEGLL